jgi:hypothetical protein
MRHAMAGRPRTRARLAAERAATQQPATGARRFAPAARTAALARAEEIGDKATSVEVGCAPATIRSWRKRQATATSPPASASGAVGDAEGDRVHDLLCRADDTRRAEARALRRTDKLLSAGLAADARAASAVAKDAGLRVVQLEQAAAAQREHELRVQAAETRLTDGQIWTFDRIIRLFISSLGWGGVRRTTILSLRC